MKHLYVVGLASLVLTGCFDGDNDDDVVTTPPPAQNDAPEVVSEAFITQTDTPVTDTLSASDPEGDNLTFALDNEPARGTVEISDGGEFTYTPADEMTGADMFTFTVSDGVNDPVNGEISITIEPLEVSFTDYTRRAFAQAPTDTPLPVNGREFIQDADNPDAFNDLLTD